MQHMLEDELCDIARKARYGLGIDLWELAQKARLDAARLSTIESGAELPTHDETHRLAHALDLDGAALWAVAQGWVPKAADEAPYAVTTLQFSQANSNGYLVTGPGLGGALWVDPGGSPEQIIGLCEAAGGLAAILVTHAHSDHVAALEKVRARFPEASIVVHEQGAQRLGLADNVRQIAGDEQLTFGSTIVNVFSAPGHSDDGLVFCLSSLAFVGDTLFAGSLGRSAAGPVTYPALLASARRILALPNDVRLLPGHGPMTTVEQERVHNPFLAHKL